MYTIRSCFNVGAAANVHVLNTSRVVRCQCFVLSFTHHGDIVAGGRAREWVGRRELKEGSMNESRFATATSA